MSHRYVVQAFTKLDNTKLGGPSHKSHFKYAALRRRNELNAMRISMRYNGFHYVVIDEKDGEFVDG